MIATKQSFPCNGQITKWRYQSRTRNPFRAIVWRPVSGNGFEVVGFNTIRVSPANTPITYVVPTSQRITVKKGDIIGWAFGPSALSYSAGSGTNDTVLSLYGDLTHTRQLAVGKVLYLNHGTPSLLRQYSLSATVDETGKCYISTMELRVCLDSIHSVQLLMKLVSAISQPWNSESTYTVFTQCYC